MEKKLFRISLLVMALILSSCQGEEKNIAKKKPVKPKTLEKVIEDSTAFLSKESQELNEKGLKEIEKGSYDAAKSLFKESLEIEPKNATIYNNLGLIAMNQDSVELAKKYFSKAIYLDSTYYNAYINYSSLLVENDYFNQSINVNNYVLKYCKDNEHIALAHFFNAYAYYSTNKKKAANEEIQRAISLYPKNDAILQNMKNLSNQINARQ